MDAFGGKKNKKRGHDLHHPQLTICMARKKGSRWHTEKKKGSHFLAHLVYTISTLAMVGGKEREVVSSPGSGHKKKRGGGEWIQLNPFSS